MIRPTWLLLGGAAGLLALTAWVSRTAPMPGELARPHGSLAGLSDASRCDECHGSDGLSESCLSCHQEIHRQHQDGRGFHGALWSEGHDECEECHGEHYGEDFLLVNDRSWRLASPDGFQHEHVPFGLHSAHDDLECEQCHRTEFATDWPVLADAEPRSASFLGLHQECRSCHDDVHGLPGTPACTDCHDQERFDPASLFEHGDHFELHGAHEDASCESCHQPIPGGSSLSRPFGATLGSDCKDCHESPHSTPNETCFGGDCTACHDSQSFAAHHYVRERHRTFPLQGAHLDLDCRSCHQDLACSLPGIPAERCESCHQNAHEENGRSLRLWSSSDCSQCHAGGTWQAPGLGAQRHEVLGFPLARAHDGVECRSCHGAAAPAESVPGSRCDACHDDPHRNRFERSCESCHALAHEGFRDAAALLEATVHERTGFALEAPHANLGCESCHAGGEYHERFPGRSSQDCAACHADPHGGQFSAAWGCVDCHRESLRFSPSRFGLDDHRGFPIRGNHRAVPCMDCHRADPDTGVRRFTGTSTSCRSCHTDPHVGQFLPATSSTDCSSCHPAFDSWRVEGFDHAQLALSTACTDCHQDPHRGQVTQEDPSCRRCHTSHDDWTRTRFDHQTMSRFVLEGVHLGLRCEQCHPVKRRPDGTRLVRYRPLGRQCEDCHEAK